MIGDDLDQLSVFCERKDFFFFLNPILRLVSQFQVMPQCRDHWHREGASPPQYQVMETFNFASQVGSLG